MNDTLLLDADLRESARLLVAAGRLTIEGDPEHYRAALQGRHALAEFFRTELNWTLEVHEVAGLIRLHKRRSDVPADRGPRLVRDRQPLAGALVMILICLACEQLWRRPRMNVRELMQAIAQVCAADTTDGRLPRFPVVASEDVSKKEARHNRQSLADALKILVAEGTITVDADLDRALADEDGDLVVTASRDRLATKFSSLSPTLLQLDGLPPDQHAAALSAASLLDHTAHTQGEAPTLEQRRLNAIRRLVDDPAADPLDDATDTTPYLHTLAGRERALNTVAALGLTATVRRDWWQITDPSGQASSIDFPNGRRTERQAALALLATLPGRDDPHRPADPHRHRGTVHPGTRPPAPLGRLLRTPSRAGPRRGRRTDQRRPAHPRARPPRYMAAHTRRAPVARPRPPAHPATRTGRHPARRPGDPPVHGVRHGRDCPHSPCRAPGPPRRRRMKPAEHPAPHLSLTAVDEPALDIPSAEGRWQPTRAGIVNSWAWASEQLYFSGGWLALVGPNGSGKSLTASMLITVLLDADTSQTALSVSGKAAGTLTSRHTDFNDREDRTGIWWLEYGLHDPADGSTRYVTTGLWLRATAGHLHRAFFLTSGRVGSDLILEQDRDPVRLDTLAGQLAACQGEMFTDSKALRGSLTQLTPQDERSYRQKVRTRLFAPLNEVQFEALLAVLRSLRSVRTAEAISPTRMRQVLTDALPALDTDNLTQVAEAMERISELKTKLERTRQEAKLLEGTDRSYRSYRRYLRTVAQAEAAALTAANTEFDDQARSLKKATDQLDTAQKAFQDAAQEYADAQSDISRARGQLSADEALLSEHAGAELPHREDRARDLAAQATAAAERAQTAGTDADEAHRKAAGSRDDADAAQVQLTRISGDLRTSATALGAQAACEHLLTASEALAAARSSADATLDTAWLCSHPLAWAEDHQRQIQAADRALGTYQHLQDNQRTAADEQHAAEDAEHARREAADQATSHRRYAKEELSARLHTWQESAPLLGPLPVQLTEPGDAEERTDTSRLTAWLSAAAAAARARIDLPGHQQRAAADTALAHAAARTADQARTHHAAARAALEQAALEAAEQALA
ncbi:hypothetical protein QQM39_45935 [Streptomyces sp. DT2A-34]|uniref:DUF2398 family protein n=1 Tax=Streptomyces sp. DT2A-34 TaxID=3051182 RepID=UPI00265BC7EB|nr:hypothetical protein [Streptomyces sp. DT2A-34]MDO0917871.1 hypothetical protein [Streptomyces sp. DT2A-34]